MWPDPTPEQEESQIQAIRTIGGNAAFHNFNNDFLHILQPNERRRLALSEIDKIPFGFYHVRAVIVAGIGFFTDSYDIFAINMAVYMLGIAFWSDSGGRVPTNVQTAIKAATSGGTVIGQICFGLLADLLGRRRMYGIELMIIIAATLVQALSSPSPALSIAALIIFWRVIMGIGIGGDYPMSSVITSEFAPTRWRGSMIAAVFSMQGFGQFAAAMVAFVTTVGFQSSFEQAALLSDCDAQCQLAADRGWRIIIGVGALPALFALYYRITIPETPRFTFDVSRDLEQAGADIHAYIEGEHKGDAGTVMEQRTKAPADAPLIQPQASLRDFISYFGNWQHGSILFGTMASWFLLDLAYYGLGLNNTTVLSAIGYSDGDTIYHILRNAAVGNLILVCAGAFPGYWLSVVLMDVVGRKSIQLLGFIMLTIIFCVIGFAYASLNKSALLALYILAQFFFNFGPNTTTFIIPGEIFPTRYRATAHGLSAASGKVGAIIAQVIAQPLLTIGAAPNCRAAACTPWLDHLMQIFALFMLLGTLVSLLVPETVGQTLEVLAGERPLRSASKGWKGSRMLIERRGWVSRFVLGPAIRSDAREDETRRSSGGSGGSGSSRATKPEPQPQHTAPRGFWGVGSRLFGSRTGNSRQGQTSRHSADGAASLGDGSETGIVGARSGMGRWSHGGGAPNRERQGSIALHDLGGLAS